MVDYAKLIKEEAARQDSAIADAETQWKREIELLAFFRQVEICLGEEMALANKELKERAAPFISGPFRPVKDAETIELAFGTRRPCCRLNLSGAVGGAGWARIHVELLDDTGNAMGKKQYFLDATNPIVKAHMSLVEGFPDRASETAPSEIAQEIITGILRGRFV